MKLYVFHGLDSTIASKLTEVIEIDHHDPKLGADLCEQAFYRFFGHIYWNREENYYSMANSIEDNKDLDLESYNAK
jgi:hypothetical protein